MKEPVWIVGDICIAIHRRVIDRFGGLDAGVRDENLFQAALARPLNKWHYDEPRPDIFALAAAYAFGLAKGHVFHDGNKRTAYVVAMTFLAVNGIECEPSQADIVATMVALAEGTIGEVDLANWLRRHRIGGAGLSETKAPAIRRTRLARRP
ncbi:MAG: type II toxin-antitoxin system death-on-curing family toxin [Dongiaceae bacterium]